ncbi:hypothetical protein Mapa_009572 [Marchantia paleacea]|nr:hypothetical protein Mapa_009572 [Marchantia paleacea]
MPVPIRSPHWRCGDLILQVCKCGDLQLRLRSSPSHSLVNSGISCWKTTVAQVNDSSRIKPFAEFRGESLTRECIVKTDVLSWGAVALGNACGGKAFNSASSGR